MPSGKCDPRNPVPDLDPDTAASVSAPVVVAIDDDAMILVMVKRTLGAAGMVCHTATTGAAGLELIRSLAPDLVLLDLVLVGEDGFSICREIRRTWSAVELPVVMVTGLEDLESIQAAYQAGATDYLTKPLHWKHLPYRIRHVLQANRAFKSLQSSTRMLTHMAYHDVLTGLWNRHALSGALERVFREIRKTEDTPFPVMAALIYLDLDNFKRINDTLGHSLGDDLLKVVASRIAGVLRPSDLLARAESSADASVARIGGDEFCLVLEKLSSPLDAGRVAQRILDALREPILLEGHELVVTPSIGIALIPQDGQDPDTLLKHADRAMYAAKESGRNRFQFFDPSMGSRLLERFAMEAGMRRGLAQGAFFVHFQPQIDARTGTVLGMEALLRWNDPEMGAITPVRFIPVAEETGLIVELGELVFREALGFNQRLQAEGLPPIPVAVNLSSAQMLDPQLLERIEHWLALTGADPRLLQVEVTESLLVEGSSQGLATLQRMKDLGITLALDDFGTGFSSLSHLHRYPFDILKIDRSFVQTLPSVSQGRTLATAIIAIGKSLGMDLIAEGVEHLDQANFLLARGCNKAQGFLYGCPMGQDAFRAFYRATLDRPVG